MSNETIYLLSEQGLRREDELATAIMDAAGIFRIMTHMRVVKENWGMLAELTDIIILDLYSGQPLTIEGMSDFFQRNSPKIIFVVTDDVEPAVKALQTGTVVKNKEQLIREIKKRLNIP